MVPSSDPLTDANPQAGDEHPWSAEQSKALRLRQLTTHPAESAAQAEGDEETAANLEEPDTAPLPRNDAYSAVEGDTSADVGGAQREAKKYAAAKSVDLEGRPETDTIDIDVDDFLLWEDEQLTASAGSRDDGPESTSSVLSLLDQHQSCFETACLRKNMTRGCYNLNPRQCNRTAS